MPKNVLTKHFDGTVLNIQTEVGLKEYFSDEDNSYNSYNGIWDTGAMMSCISPKVAEELSLSPVDLISVGGVGNERMRCPVYLLDFKLSSGMEIKGVRVAGAKPAGADVLIGMDVISRGDFSIFRDGQGDMNMSFELKMD